MDEPATVTPTSLILKVVELIICIIALVFICLGAARFWSTGSVLAVFGVGGYIIILIVLVVLYVLDQASLLMELLFLSIGGVLNLFAGILSLIMPGERAYGEYPRGNSNSYRVIVAFLCMLNGLIMLVDCILAYRRKNS